MKSKSATGKQKSPQVKPAKMPEYMEMYSPQTYIDYTIYNNKLHPLSLIEHCSDGKSKAEVCHAWKITRKTMRKWQDDFPEFNDAMYRAREAFTAYWHCLARETAAGKRSGAAAVLIFSLKNHIGFDDQGQDSWADSEEHELEFIVE